MLFVVVVVQSLLLLSIASSVAASCSGLRNQSSSDVERFNFTSVCSRTGGSIHLGGLRGSDISTILTRAFIFYNCFNSSGEVILSEREPTEGEKRSSFNTDIWTEDVTQPLTCDFSGCYETSGPRQKFLDIPSCYIDFDECKETHDCDANATCINNVTGTYSCQCNEDFVGNGSKCYKKVPPSVYLVEPTPLVGVVDPTLEVEEGTDLNITAMMTYDEMDITNYLTTNLSWTLPPNATVNSTMAQMGPMAFSLYLPSLLPGDSGTYSVMATNDAGTTTVNFTLTVIHHLPVNNSTTDLTPGPIATTEHQTTEVTSREILLRKEYHNVLYFTAPPLAGLLGLALLILMLSAALKHIQLQKRAKWNQIHHGVGMIFVENNEIQDPVFSLKSQHYVCKETDLYSLHECLYKGTQILEPLTSEASSLSDTIAEKKPFVSTKGLVDIETEIQAACKDEASTLEKDTAHGTPTNEEVISLEKKPKAEDPPRIHVYNFEPSLQHEVATVATTSSLPEEEQSHHASLESLKTQVPSIEYTFVTPQCTRKNLDSNEGYRKGFEYLASTACLEKSYNATDSQIASPKELDDCTINFETSYW